MQSKYIAKVDMYRYNQNQDSNNSFLHIMTDGSLLIAKVMR